MKNNFIKKLIIVIIGLIFCGIGVSLFLYAQLGVDPASVFQLGIASQLNISYGSASAFMNIVILIIVFFVDRSYISVASLLAIFLIGYTADIFNHIYININLATNNLILQLTYVFVGLLIMSTGIAIYIYGGLGVGAVDLVSELISDKTGIQYQVVRISVDVTFIVIGVILGGKFGIGTLIAGFLTGPTVQLVRPYILNLISNKDKE